MHLSWAWDDDGQAIAIVAIFLTVLAVAAIGFVDLGRAQVRLSRVESAAARGAEAAASVLGDAVAREQRAAYLASGSIDLSASGWASVLASPDVREAARSIVTANLPGLTSVVDVIDPDASDPRTLAASPPRQLRVEVRVSVPMEMYLGSAFGRPMLTIRGAARAAYPLSP